MTKKYQISLITGDGIGPEISESAFSILQEIHDNMGIKFEIKKLEALTLSMSSHSNNSRYDRGYDRGYNKPTHTNTKPTQLSNMGSIVLLFGTIANTALS